MKLMQDSDRAFFEPLWRRILLVVVVAAWSAWEWSNGDSFWGTLTLGVTAYAVWAYLIAFPGPAEPGKDQTSAKE
jgi:hypothetical protein